MWWRFSIRCITTAVLVTTSFTSWAYQPKPQRLPKTSRRAFLAFATTAVVAAAPAPCTTNAAHALDMEAFVQQELSKDSNKPILSEDAALCKYGSPSPPTGEACVRAGLPTTRAASGVDAFGRANRGDFVRCKQFYEDNGQGKYVKRTACSDGTVR